MDRKKLETELQKFCDACQDNELPIFIEGLSEAYPGVSDTSFTVHIRVNSWSTGLSCSEILDKILPILWESTTEETRQNIFSLDVYNADDGINCHHVNTFQKFELAC